MKQLILTLILIGPSMVFAHGPNEMLVVEYEVEYDLSWKFKLLASMMPLPETMTIYYSDYGKRVESHDELAAGMTNSTTIISNYKTLDLHINTIISYDGTDSTITKNKEDVITA